MTVANDLIEEPLYRFLEEYGDNRVKRELLAFWGRHPNAKFSSRVLCYAVDCNWLDADRALKALVEAGLVATHIYNDVPLYSLTRNQERRRPVVALAALDWDRWLLMLRRIEQGDKAANYQHGVRGS